MRSFNDVYKASKESVKAAQAAQIELQRKEIISAMSEVYGVKNFGSLNETEKEKYHGLLLEYWNQKTGITKKGELLIKESKKTIIPTSSEAEIKEYYQNEIHKNIKGCLESLSNPSVATGTSISGIARKCKELIGYGKVKDTLYESWAKEQISKDINEMVKID